ncbi:AAA family ATPase [Roseburia faecis]|uniref:AAA family ATPase n=1 Tax=Roseburia faecis TaxID=301302 RepID=UPI0031B57FFE
MDEDEIYKFTAIITYEQYYSDDSTWGVFGFSTKDDIPFFTKPTKTFDPFSDNKTSDEENKKMSKLAGKMQHLVVGGEYVVKAKYKKDKKYGDQYTPIAIYAIIPQSRETQLLFLKSMIPEWMADNLINAYPNVVNDVANGTLKTIDYSLVKGVREITWNKIKEKIINNYLISDIISMLKPIGVTYAMIKKLLSEEPNPVLLKQELEKNPYIMTKIDGIGFRKCDDLALKLKPELIDSTQRLVAFIQYYFKDLGESKGHTWCSEKILRAAISNNIYECCNKVDWLLENNDFLHIDNGRIGLKYYYDIEMQIYHLILNKSQIETTINISDEAIDKAIKHAEEEQGFDYVVEQLDTIHKSLHRTVSLITGKAGTGKTSIMRAIVKAYMENNYMMTASALSAMAAQRITEATEFPAMTIHRTLGCQGLNDFTYNKDNHLITDVAFLDEGSMVNASLFLHWLEAIGDNTRIIISGDYKQLPPIGFGNVFSDLIEMFDESVVSKLVKPMRQAEKSGILVDANKIRENINPISEKLQPRIIHGELQDMYYMFRTNRQSLFNIAIKTFIKSVESDGIDNVVIAVPRRKDCLNSTNEINKVIQNELLGDVLESIEGFDTTFKLGAKVMQTVNDYDKNVFNGEIGYVTKISERYDGKKKEEYCEVTYTDIFGKDKIIEYTKKELTALDLAYAMTVHKLQGAGRKTVIGIIDNTHHQLLDNCMLYTLLTRAKKRCLLLAEPEAFLQCIRTSHNNRNTWMMLEAENNTVEE